MEPRRTTRIRRYSELILLKTFQERFEYLKLDGSVGFDTFGFDRYLNQAFYHSPEWKHFRQKIILRDNACDLALEGYELRYGIYIHHMNPVERTDIIRHAEEILDPEFVVVVSFATHNAIHYGTGTMPSKPFVERSPNDTCPWKQ